tara:strand:- start:3551 stop:3892 length:342 start_codon:yes stop_codon:yes gene_type:complete
VKARVTESYRSAYANPIAFLQGDLVRVGVTDDEYPGWVWVIIADGNEGWAPLKYLEHPESGDAVANTDYSARELDADAGEAVEVLKYLDGWVWCVNHEGQCGWLPASVLDSFR